MKITANKKKQSFEPIELTVVIESEEEFKQLQKYMLSGIRVPWTEHDFFADRLIKDIYKAAKEAKE